MSIKASQAADAPASQAASNTLQDQPAATAAEIDRALYKELIKLARFNIKFQLEANRHQPWRDVLYPIERETGTGLSFAATLIDLNQQAKNLDHPRLISKNELRNAVTCGITGSAISGTASALELAQNTWVMSQATKNGYSPRSSLAFVKGIIARTDDLLEQRKRMAMQQERPTKSVMELEERLVRRIREQLLFEFGTWSCHSREQAWSENTFYAIDSLQSFGRMAAGITTMRAFGQPTLSRGAVVCALVSNSAATVNPIVRNIAGYVIRKHQKHKLKREIAYSRPVDDPELDQLQEKLSNRLEQQWLRRVAALNVRSEAMDTILDRETKQIRRYRQVAQQQSISGPLIGLTGVASSTLATDAIYNNFELPKNSIRLGFAGRITQGTGQAYALINTPYTTVKGMVMNRKLSKRGELPKQILEQRLTKLELSERN